MASSLRRMELKDIPQVSQIEREAFPPPWPATNFKRDLSLNGLTHYLVAYESSRRRNEPPASIAPQNVVAPPTRSAFQMVRSILQRLPGWDHPSQDGMECILGFAAIWFMADESHLSNIAVRRSHQHCGIGELLVISVIKLAIEQSARFVTLEVRRTNSTAQRLYTKCGFVEVGVRRGYYSDNKEDAVLMTAEAITSEGFMRSFEDVRAAYAAKWGTPV